MTHPVTTTPAPLVTREALQAFTQRLVAQFAPQQVILFGSQARGEARWDSDADILVVMPFKGKPLESVKAMHEAGAAEFPLDLHLRRPEEIAPRHRWGIPSSARPWITAGFCMVSSTAATSNAAAFTPQPAIRWWRNGSSGQNATGGWQSFCLICRPGI